MRATKTIIPTELSAFNRNRADERTAPTQHASETEMISQNGFNAGNLSERRIWRRTEYLLDVLGQLLGLFVVRHLQLLLFAALLYTGVLFDVHKTKTKII